MHPETETSAAYDEVLRKIGRNLLLFQQAELIIKRLMKLGSYTAIQGAAKDPQPDPHCQMTLGQLRNLYVQKYLSQQPAPPSSSSTEPSASGLSIQINFTLGLSSSESEARKLELDQLITERNQLVHHQFSTLNPESLERCRTAAAALDEQRHRILPSILHLQQDLSNVNDGLKIITDQLHSNEAMRQLFLQEIKESPLIQNLITIAQQSTDADGWTMLREAITKLQDFPEEKIREQCSQFGMKSLSALLEASRHFEIRMLGASESSKGQTQYRLIQQPSAPIPQTHPTP